MILCDTCNSFVRSGMERDNLSTSPTPYSFGHMPPVDTVLTLGPINALCVLALVCLLWNINA